MRQGEHPLAGKKWNMQWFNRKIVKMFMDFLPHFGDFWRWASRSQAFSLTRGIRVKPLNVMHGSLVLVKTFEAHSVARFQGFAVHFFWGAHKIWRNISVDLPLSSIEQITCIHVFFPRNFFVENLKFFSFFALKESRSSRYQDQSFFPKSKHEIRINRRFCNFSFTRW